MGEAVGCTTSVEESEAHVADAATGTPFAMPCALTVTVLLPVPDCSPRQRKWAVAPAGIRAKLAGEAGPSATTADPVEAICGWSGDTSSSSTPTPLLRISVKATPLPLLNAKQLADSPPAFTGGASVGGTGVRVARGSTGV